MNKYMTFLKIKTQDFKDSYWLWLSVGLYMEFLANNPLLPSNVL